MSENIENSGLQVEKEDKRKSMPHLFKPGQSGNPSGRRKGSKSLTAALHRRILDGDVDTIANNLIELATKKPEQIQLAGRGNEVYTAIDSNEAKLHQWAVDTILERIDGKVSQPIDQTSTHTDLSEFSAEDLQAFREWLKERKAAESE